MKKILMLGFMLIATNAIADVDVVTVNSDSDFNNTGFSQGNIDGDTNEAYSQDDRERAMEDSNQIHENADIHQFSGGRR